jgi:hypothetical protein
MMKIKATAYHTGEILELEYKNEDDLIKLYNEYYLQKKNIEATLDKIKEAIGENIPEDQPHQFFDGSVARWMRLPRYEYPKEVVAEYLDPDQLDVVSKIDGTKLKSVVKELAERNEIEAGAWDRIMQNAEVKYSKPFVKIERQ